MAHRPVPQKKPLDSGRNWDQFTLLSGVGLDLGESTWKDMYHLGVCVVVTIL